MRENWVELAENDTTVKLGVQLVGSAVEPVHAWFNLYAAENSSMWLSEEVDLWLKPSELSWDANDTGVRYVQLHAAPDLLDGLEDQSLYVRIGSATNADIEQLEDTTLLSRQHHRPKYLFGFVRNQVVLPGEQARIPVELVLGKLTEPATLRYNVSFLTPSDEQYLPSKALTGFVVFHPNQTQQNITLPLVWSAIPPHAEYRLGLELEGLWGAETKPQPDDVALHIFGVANGTCPPGSAVTSLLPVNSTFNDQPGQEEGGQEEGGEEKAGASDMFLVVNGTAVYLPTRSAGGSRTYSAMVEYEGSTALLCAKEAEDVPAARLYHRSSKGGAQLKAATSRQRCSCAAYEEKASGAKKQRPSSNGCGFAAWQLDLAVGQNLFNLTAVQANATADAPVGTTSGSSSSSSGVGSSTGAAANRTLAVVRLDKPEHAKLGSLTMWSSDGTSVVLCGSPVQQREAGLLQQQRWLEDVPLEGSGGGRSSSADSRNDSGSAVAAMQQLLSREFKAAPVVLNATTCRAGVTMSVNVSFATEMITLAPSLEFGEVQGMRVEVNGKVLSRGWDAGADADLQGASRSFPDNSSTPTGFLPAAFFMGLQPGVPVDIEVVVVASDGVTSRRYPIAVTRLPEYAPPPAPELFLGPPLSENDTDPGVWLDAEAVVEYTAPVNSTEKQERNGWPKSPAQQEGCTICPAGWASWEVNATQCSMCPPGTYAEKPQSPRCLPCQPGSSSYSWGSSHCKLCIAGTYAPLPQSSLCEMCPKGWTTLRDGQPRCSVPATPQLDLSQRYAVVVSFNVVLTGLVLESIVPKAGVNAPVEHIVGSLLQADTASAFNISMQDVSVKMSLFRQQPRRSLQANVTAALGVELPEGATEEDIAAALDVQKLSADAPIEMLSEDPDRFFGRTTKTLDVEVQSGQAAAITNWPASSSRRASALYLLIPGILGLLVGGCLVVWACMRSPRCTKWWQRQRRRWQDWRSSRAGATWQLPTALVGSLGRGAQRYTRYRS